MLTLIRKHKILSTIIIMFIVLWTIIYGVPIIKKHFDNYRMRPDMVALKTKVSTLGSTKFTDTCGFVEDTYSRRSTVCTMRVYTHVEGENDKDIKKAVNEYYHNIIGSNTFTNVGDESIQDLARLENLYSDLVMGIRYHFIHTKTKRPCSLQYSPSKDMSESHGQPGTTISFTCSYH